MDTSAKWQARAPTVGGDTRVGAVRQRPTAHGAKDPFQLGFRERTTTTPDGRQVLEQVPLTAEDLVYPQEGDHVSQGTPHFRFLHPQADAMRRYLEKRPGIAVTSDVTLVLRHDGKKSEVEPRKKDRPKRTYCGANASGSRSSGVELKI